MNEHEWQNYVWLAVTPDDRVLAAFLRFEMAKDSVTLSYHLHEARDTLQFVNLPDGRSVEFSINGEIKGRLRMVNLETSVTHI